MASGIMGFTGETWTNIYNQILAEYELPEALRKRLAGNLFKIQKIFESIDGEWWNRGFLQRFYKIENRCGKAAYEMRKEMQAVAILQNDLADVRIFLEGKSFEEKDSANRS